MLVLSGLERLLAWVRAVPMENLLQFPSLLITHASHQFADVAQELMKKERGKGRKDFCTWKRRSHGYRDTNKLEKSRW
jgi:hypothetical protein